MKFPFQFVALFAVVANGFSEEHAWNDYKLTHGKDYTTFFGGGWMEGQNAQETFPSRIRQLVNQHNSNESRSYSQELNRFSDMRPSEKSGYLGVLKSSMAPSIQVMKSIHGDDDDDLPQNRKALPEALDYRTDNCIAAVKDQKKMWKLLGVRCSRSNRTPVVLRIKKMRFAFQFVVFAVSVCTANGHSDDEAWNDYKLQHGKDYMSYLDGGLHDNERKELFLAQRDKIHQHNNGDSPSFNKELNKFSDMWPSEKSKYLGLKSSRAPSSQFMNSIQRYYPLLDNRQSLPAELDHRSDDCMAAIKDQGSCGSCWAFAAVTPLEFNSCKKHQQTPVALSEQQLVDCDIFNNGCNGGWYTQAWQHIKLAGGLARESLYPYTATRNFCPFWLLWFMTGARVYKYDYAPANDAVAMQSALQQYGPLTVAFAVANSFFSYRNGVYDATDCDNVDVNHAVVIVGWGSQGGIDYWIIRNSWGTGWGDNGYGLIHRGVNKCKIESYPAYVRPL